MPERLASLLLSDPNVVRVLETVRDHGPEKAFVAAGFVRNRVWDSLYERNGPFPDIDIDVVYFDRQKPEKMHDLAFEKQLETRLPNGIWQVRNQARMHKFGGHPPFADIEEALRHWAETATTVGLRLTHTNEPEFIAPFGFEDLFDHVLRITPAMKRHDPAGFSARLKAKGWLARWPRLRVFAS